jgi:uncharacterized membrane protein
VTSLGRRLAGSALAGAASGARSATGLAALTLATRPGAASLPDRVLGRPWVKAAVGVLAGPEYVVDKLPATPSRLTPAGLAPRLAGAAVSGVVIARREPDAVTAAGPAACCAVIGLGAAVATAWLGWHWRAWAAARLGHDWIGAGLEDVTTLTLAATAAALTAGSGGTDMPRAQIKDEKTYQALRREGNSEEKSARIANAAAGSTRHSVGNKGGRSGSYQDWSKQDLLKRARELGISGRSSMSKDELIKALRDH